MLMGQVWSKADCDGTNAAGHEGGRGSVLAVTAQNSEMPTPLNKRPADVTHDHSTGGGCRDPLDRVRGFLSLHAGGAHFLLGDGSVQFVSETMNQDVYQALSTIRGGEVVGEF